MFVIGLEIDGHFKACPFIELSRHKGAVVDHVGSNKVLVIVEPELDNGRVERSDGTGIPTVISYWFAWYAFHPQTDVFRAVLKQ